MNRFILGLLMLLFSVPGTGYSQQSSGMLDRIMFNFGDMPIQEMQKAALLDNGLAMLELQFETQGLPVHAACIEPGGAINGDNILYSYPVYGNHDGSTMTNMTLKWAALPNAYSHNTSVLRASILTAGHNSGYYISVPGGVRVWSAWTNTGIAGSFSP